MKKCPNCQKTFDDSKRFCQVDGTPLVDEVEPIQTEDPFKTVVIGQNALNNVSEDPMKTMVIRGDAKDEDILQIPEEFDPMKTMVVSEPIKLDNPVVKAPVNEPVVPAPEPPKFNEPDLSPPKLEDLTPIELPKIETPVAATPFNQPPPSTPVSNPFNEPPKVENKPINPFNEPPKVESPFNTPSSSPISSPFEQKSEPISTPFKEPETPFNAPPSPFDSPFNQPSEPVGQELQSNWNPPPVPNDQWNQQDIGSNTPFQPPAAGTAGGQNQTLGIITLVLGIVGLLCLGFLTGVPALITGLMTLKNIKKDPVQYGGKVLAIIGMVLGALGTLWSIAYLVFMIFVFASA